MTGIKYYAEIKSSQGNPIWWTGQCWSANGMDTKKYTSKGRMMASLEKHYTKEEIAKNVTVKELYLF